LTGLTKSITTATPSFQRTTESMVLSAKVKMDSGLRRNDGRDGPAEHDGRKASMTTDHD
jgi:hypothetical protein